MYPLAVLPDGEFNAILSPFVAFVIITVGDSTSSPSGSDIPSIVNKTVFVFIGNCTVEGVTEKLGGWLFAIPTLKL